MEGEVLNGREPGIHGRIESALEAASFEWVDKSERRNGYEEKIVKQL